EESYGAQVLVERRRADIHRLREHVERHAAPSRVFEIDHDAPVETSELALRARIADRGDREAMRVRAGSIRQFVAATAGACARTPSRNPAQTIRARRTILPRVVIVSSSMCQRPSEQSRGLIYSST